MPLGDPHRYRLGDTKEHLLFPVITDMRCFRYDDGIRSSFVLGYSFFHGYTNSGSNLVKMDKRS